jgi:mycofactocin system glycosyltransferase
VSAAVETAPATDAVALHPDVRVLEGGRLLVGGWPLRILRLGDDAAQAVAGWRQPAPVGDDPARRRLARRLLDAELLLPHPPPAASTADLTVVVPVRDRTAQLERCLDAVRRTCPDSPVVVVDDGSADPRATAAACERRGAAFAGHPRSRGPAAARNTGLRAAGTPFVAFVDSDVVVSPGWAHRLLGHFGDRRVAAVAPRVVALEPGRTPVGAYEQRHSPLDMGARAGIVGAGRLTPYVPSAVLLVRRAAAGDGFDEALPIGEDVDLVWRLVAAGWKVRYAPDALVRHDHRLGLTEFLARRRLYAMSVAILARRHPEALPAARVSRAVAAPWALAALGRRRPAVALAAVEVLRLAAKLRGIAVHPHRLAAAMFAQALAATGAHLAQAVRRAWTPLLLVMPVGRRRARRVVLAAFAAAIVEDAIETRRPTAVLVDAPLRLLDEVVALAGTWEGCVRQRTLRPLALARRAPARQDAVMDVPADRAPT